MRSIPTAIIAMVCFLYFCLPSLQAQNKSQAIQKDSNTIIINNNSESEEDEGEDDEDDEEDEEEKTTNKAPTPPTTQPKPTIDQKTSPKTVVAAAPKKQNFEPFTGRITKSKVRMRLQPNFDGLTLQELNKDQLIVVLGESEDFYAIQPAADFKAYVFRTYVLDNVIEGTRVNVRLKPDLDAPVIAQLNSGDRVDGHIYTQNTKWLEIPVPASTRFYIAKEYIEKAGDAGYLARMEKRREEVYRLLSTNKTVSDIEMQKNFSQINLDGIIANYKRILNDYKDFPEAGAKAQEYLSALQIDYTNRKLAFLEQQSEQSGQLEKKNQELAKLLNDQKSKLSKLEQEMQREKNLGVVNTSESSKTSSQIPYNMAAWVPLENALFTAWVNETNNDSPSAFYQQQMNEAITLKGIIDPYNRPVKNKPGDYMLLNGATKLPIAFLYSTQVNLQNYVGHEIAIKVVPRNNFNYAFPAYFVLSIE